MSRIITSIANSSNRLKQLRRAKRRSSTGDTAGRGAIQRLTPTSSYFPSPGTCSRKTRNVVVVALILSFLFSSLIGTELREGGAILLLGGEIEKNANQFGEFFHVECRPHVNLFLSRTWRFFFFAHLKISVLWCSFDSFF